jgi:hypothetical protein
MTQPHLSSAEHPRRFAEELDVLASRSENQTPVPPDEVEAIFAEHEAECLALDAIGRDVEAERNRAGRRT